MISKMNTTKFTDNELNLMSYQDLRRLSILLRLPANIKKTYMISMIQAHQKGDGFTKTAIANKVMEERKVKKMTTKGRQAKPFLMVSTTTTQQIPTDLSVSTKHEIETRFSYVAHYTSKDNTNSGISRIIKEEAEVSRRNRNILHQTRKPSRKIPTMGRTEIMLPRNHSLTTPVRLMPQYERGYSPLTQYETVSGMTNTKAHYQDGGSYNYHFHGEYSNTMMTTSSSTHEMYRNETYWPPREMYNNSLMPILSSLLTPNSVSIPSPGFTAQYPSQNPVGDSQTSFQGIYEKYIKAGNLMEGQSGSYSSNAGSSTVIVNNSHYSEANENEGNFMMAKNDMDFEVEPAVVDVSYQHYNRRDDTVIRHSNNSQSFPMETYSSRSENEETDSSPRPPNREMSQYIREFFALEEASHIPSCAGETSHRKSNVSFQSSLKVNGLETKQCHVNSSHIDQDLRKITENEERNWEASETSNRNEDWRESFGKSGVLTVPVTESRNNILSDVSESSNECPGEGGPDTNVWDKNSTGEKHLPPVFNLQRCRYILGHNKFPEAVNKKKETTATTILPSFWSTFCTYGAHNKAYSLCRNTFTGTTEAHINPIMTSTHATQYASYGNSQLTSNNPEESPQLSCPWIYSYPEAQSTFPVENGPSYSTWNEYSNEMGDKLVAHDSAHEVQILKCRKHGCHYLYSVSNACN